MSKKAINNEQQTLLTSL